ncbi:MAG: hypothetical protein KUA37_14200 [Desulfomicrobium sp.]|uniref:hypothetical protein n=1 Tax=Hoeflea sp. TaxID=1940281 RepID=UPI0025C0FF71|nr:hypothetical protein [Hoeflea sp.]MBU4530897.1 hypothetical protein [Alphaproteobacteria bacterium]MBV1713135.1 hypothetical protein [Desulfomicrobium sp.]MBU4542348.1 hypothetical protein [Alphaproteobacteria bacterium]MBU4551112.1 hypothetical protein [Alphaproteobacteria bacterium]MBV1785070.1 hypothetical protein [Hoeflea sp.]
MKKLLAFLTLIFFAHSVLLQAIAQTHGDAMVLVVSSQAEWSKPAAKSAPKACCRDPESSGGHGLSSCSTDCHYLPVEVLMLPISAVPAAVRVAPPADVFRDMIHGPMKPPILS